MESVIVVLFLIDYLDVVERVLWWGVCGKCIVVGDCVIFGMFSGNCGKVKYWWELFCRF